MTRRVSCRGIRTHRSYTVEEVARLHKVTPHTVRRWVKDGLPVLKDQRPFLILGGDLADFLSASKTPKQRCAPDECYCVKCRMPRRAAEGMAEYVPVSDLTGNLRAFCPVCHTLMHKTVSAKALPTLQGLLSLTVAPRPPNIRDGS